MDFTIEGDNIRFGLLSIKGISEKSIEKINNFKDIYANKFEIFKAAEEAKLNIGVLSALIQAGALQEGVEQGRSKVVLEAQLWNLLTSREKKYVLNLGEKMKFDLVEILKFLIRFKDEKNKVVIKESRYETIKKKYKPYLNIYMLNSKAENFANWYYEKMLLGYTYNKTLIDIFSEKRKDLQGIREIMELPERVNTAFIGRVEDVWKGKSRAGNKYLKIEVSDETGTIQALIFNDNIDKCESMNSGLPEKKNIVIVKGRKTDGDAVFANMIGVQDQKVYTKLSELKS
jgi:DNA polymerase III alpha subunit